LTAPTLTASRPPISPDVSDIWKTHARIRTIQRETKSMRLSGDRLQVSMTSFQFRTRSPGLLARSAGCVTAIESLLGFGHSLVPIGLNSTGLADLPYGQEGLSPAAADFLTRKSAFLALP
jgi:hypothetical protein